MHAWESQCGSQQAEEPETELETSQERHSFQRWCARARYHMLLAHGHMGTLQPCKSPGDSFCLVCMHGAR